MTRDVCLNGPAVGSLFEILLPVVVFSMVCFFSGKVWRLRFLSCPISKQRLEWAYIYTHVCYFIVFIYTATAYVIQENVLKKKESVKCPFKKKDVDALVLINLL